MTLERVTHLTPAQRVICRVGQRVYHPLVIRRLYIHNFRCLENFELPIANQPSVLLIGKNGTGKTTVGLAIEILQRIARGANRVGDLVRQKDFARGRTDVPIRIEIEVELRTDIFRYDIAFELPPDFKELRVAEEKLLINGSPVYDRKMALVQLTPRGKTKEAKFTIDWHLVALPIIQEQSRDHPLNVFKQWLSRVLVLRPIPSLITGDSDTETLQPNTRVSDFGAWFTGLLTYAPAAYSSIDRYLRQLLPDLKDIKNPSVGKDAKSLVVQFSTETGTFSVPFDDLSDGEKCFMICAMVLASNEAYGPILCFWDEPDNYLAPFEVAHFIMSLRKAFQSGGQLIATSHNPEAIRQFADENTVVLHRTNHLQPTVVRRLADGSLNDDLVGSFVLGDFDL